MHELSLTEGVLRTLEELASTQGFSSVKTIWLEIGDLSQVAPEAMLFCFEAIAKTSPLTAGATLEIIRIPGRALCPLCEVIVEVAHRVELCPCCKENVLSVIGGEEMRIKELEVE